jgi:UPF0755 protein
MLRRLSLLALVAILALGTSTAWYVRRALTTEVRPPASGVVVTIPPGASFRAIAAKLQRAGVLRHPLLLTLWARYRGDDRAVRSGEYRLEEPVSPLRLLEILRSPSRALRWVTIPEGLTARQVAETLEEAGFGGRDVFRCVMEDPAIAADFDLPSTGVEGYLFPDTYAFDWATPPAEIVRLLLERFRQESAALRERRIASGLTEAEMVTLASVIEKETGSAEERALISGVFHNRLRIGMRLQSDPTVLYGRGPASGPITREDLANPSPYNTYAHSGLPPGPIANPGRASLQAAIAPQETKALYFVSRNDGSHEFSNSLAEHNRAVHRFQLGR